MTIKVTKADALQFLRNAVEREGEDRYAGCIYVTVDDDGQYQPCCIVGNILVHDLGVKPRALFLGLPDLKLEEVVPTLESDFGVTLTYDACRILSAAQSLQDGEQVNGEKSWGEAVKAASAL